MARPGPRTTYRYSREFKATAVRLCQIPGVVVGDVAESLCIQAIFLDVVARNAIVVARMFLWAPNTDDSWVPREQ
ncbi:hypothetical protein SAMN05216289_11783 [Dokdonella immobilis]|uniref:Transposase n=1 Tax=Dokdonella immobilis TaxID=578942 RepID=A0A1I4YHR4_9GAMM|nr:hypothetical protein SAMN05216289_11783 [Dokdonella immobilis]